MTFMKKFAMVATFTALGLAAPTFAVDHTWIGGSGANKDFTNPSNWSPASGSGTIPGASDRAIFQNSDTPVFTTFPSSPYTLGTLKLEDSAQVALAPGASYVLNVGTVEVKDSAQLGMTAASPTWQMNISSAFSVEQAASLTINAYLRTTAQLVNDGVTTISSAGVLEMASGADVNDNNPMTPPDLINNGKFKVTGSNTVTISANQQLGDTVGAPRSEWISDSAGSVLEFSAAYNSLVGNFIVNTATSQISINGDITTTGSFSATPYGGNVCDAIVGSGTFTWNGSSCTP